MPIVVNQNGSITDFTDSLKLRSDTVQEFISRKPNLFIRWGTILFFIILALLGSVCWFIQYPELVVSKARLNSINAPKEVVTKTDGKLQKLLVKNNDSVSAGAVLAYMESIAKPEAIASLKNQLDSIIELINQNKTDEVVRYFPDYANQHYLSELGELQTSFQPFIQSFVAFKDYISNGFYLRKKKMLLKDLQNILRLHTILNNQKKLLEQDLLLTKETFNANESLAKDKVISAMDYRNEESKLIGKQLSLPQINSSIVSNESQQNEKNKEIAELENQILVQKNNFIQALQTLYSQILSWEYKYVLKAPVAGKVSFTGFLQENQQIKQGQMLFYVQPHNTSYFVEMLIPQTNFGKVKEGQNVLLKFFAYPYEQFGSVTGKIEFISTTPTDSGFLAKIILPNGLTTNYNKTIQYQNGLYAQGEIITENMRLLERFYYNISKQIRR